MWSFKVLWLVRLATQRHLPRLPIASIRLLRDLQVERMHPVQRRVLLLLKRAHEKNGVYGVLNVVMGGAALVFGIICLVMHWLLER